MYNKWQVRIEVWSVNISIINFFCMAICPSEWLTENNCLLLVVISIYRPLQMANLHLCVVHQISVKKCSISFLYLNGQSCFPQSLFLGFDNGILADMTDPDVCKESVWLGFFSYVSAITVKISPRSCCLHKVDLSPTLLRQQADLALLLLYPYRLK